ncbi:hypothetical protein M408DRAFT_111158 [Serendipita vermifera MAFF 305830]|uniref:Uncharacterized protein n=1 Tax=Serendipita vermifera MAFF 305830 TaxID=933852 RepID=A0A0C2W3R9_SERVB|nr:hypothetical protein M408DRAFT_111158 [Serendipita vermifera MAFF 305830]
MTNATPSELTDSTAPELDASAAPPPSNEGLMLSIELSTMPGSISEEPLFSATPESSAPAPLPIVEPATSKSPSASSLPLSFDDTNEDLPVGHTRPRQASVVSSSSAYSPSVHTTNSGVNAPAFPGGEPEHRKGGHHDETAKFYVGRESWEERAWLQLIKIREIMFWARLRGVRY